MNQLQQMMMQAQKMQRELKKAHDELNQKEFVVEKAGILKLSLLGDKTIKSIDINPDALEKDNKEMLEETLVLSFNEAIAKIKMANDKIDEEITGQKGGLPF